MAEKMTDVDESMSLEPEEDIPVDESMSLEPEEEKDESMSLEPEEEIDESMSLESEEDIGGESVSLKPEEDMDESMSLKPKEIPNKPRFDFSDKIIEPKFDFSDKIVGEDASFNGAQKKVARIQWPWPKKWSRRRIQGTYLGLLSSVTVLTVRLILDREPTAYVIHSIVVFFDMVLIHLFTNCIWLSVFGELTTILCALCFHLTNETLFELLETVFIAMLCSFHLIRSRSKALDGKEEKELEMVSLVRETSILLRQHSTREGIGVDLVNVDEEQPSAGMDFACSARWSVSPHDPVEEPVSTHRTKMLVCGRHFFDHFLDGSAGVMYTSFLGLVIDEIIRYGNEKAY